MPYRQDIQILRGLAVLLVVLFHFEVPFFERGFLGVDIFFVISGYLMAVLYNKGTALDFYKRRIFRLLPAYAVTIIATLIISYSLLIPVDFNQLYDQSLASAGFASNIHFWYLNSYFDKSAFKPLLNLWSLGVEMQFYLIVPLLYPIIHKRKYLLWAAIISCFVACLVMTQISPKTSFFITPFRVWEFLLGAWVAWSVTGGKDYKSLSQISVLGLLLVTSIFLPVLPDQKSWLWGHPGLVTLIVCALTAGVLALGMPKKLESSFIGNGLAKLGDYSYSIYLVHFPLIVLWNYSAFSGTVLSAGSISQAIHMVLSIGIASYLLYNFVERNKAPIFKNIYFNLGLLLTIVVVCFVDAHTIQKKYTTEQQNIFAAWEDKSVYRCGKKFRLLNPRESVCRLTKADSDNRILLIGNSHADSIKTEMAKIADENDVALYFYVSNDPIISSDISVGRVLEDIKRLNIQKIVLHYSNIYENESHNKEISKLIDLALAQGVKVSLIAPVPVYPVHVPQAMYGEEVFAVDFKAYQAQISDFNVYKQTLDKRVRLYYPANMLCPNKKECLYAAEDKKPYYYDSAHLTLSGAALLNDMFDKIIDD